MKIGVWFFILLLAGEAHAVGNRKTQTLVLENGLEVLLLSDPDVDRSAAALSVGVGHLWDPENKNGLAHYLEHMLFLGTKKYPEVGAFKKYLNARSGASNAYTGADVTNYFFQVTHEGYEGALDRFSDFFRAPLFDPKYAEREVHAVNSEFDKNRKQDGWRVNHLINQVSEPGHPLKKFGIGNKDTLAGDNRPALLEFHKKYYSASNMKLAMLSSQPLAVLEDYAKKYFADIPNRPIAPPPAPIAPVFRKPLKDKYRLLQVKTIKNTRHLGMEFPTIRLFDHHEGKPGSIVGTVMGYEGKGSLLSKLKEEGLALGLSAGGGFSHPNLSSFDINISLTQKGEQEYQRVMELVFSYIEMLRKTGFKKYTFDEAKAMAQINFDWQEPQEGMGFAAGQTALMQNYPLERVETLPFLYYKYEPETYKAILDTLRPENMLVTLKTPRVKTDKVEHFFGTEYSLTEVGGESFKRLVNPPKAEGMTYPAKNDFIPYKLDLVKERPHLVRDDAMARIWFQFDSRFKQPKTYLKFLIETPKVYDSPENLARAQLYEAAFREGLNELTYPISLAGLSYGLGMEKKGLTLSIGGYSERIMDLLKLVAKSLKEVKISEQKFQDIKESMIRSIKNAKLGQAYHRASYFNRQIWQPKQYTEEQLLAGMESVTLDQVKKFPDTVFEKIFVTGIAHGNWSDAKVAESTDLLLKELNSKPLPENERYKEVIRVLDASKTIEFSKQVEDNNNALIYGLQIGERNLKNSAASSLVASVVESDFYTQMRTNQQLGYIVWSFNHRMEDRLFFKLIIQSGGYGPFELKKRVEKWMEGSSRLFDNLSDEEFEKHRSALIVSLEKKGDSTAEVAGDIYYFAVDEKGNFEYKEQLVAAVKKLSKQDVVAMGKEILQSAKTARSVILVRSKSNKDAVPEGVLTKIEQLKSIGS